MHKVALSAMAVLALSTQMVMGGGDIAPVEPAVAVPVVSDQEDNSDFYVGLGLIYNRIYATDSKWFSEVDTEDNEGGISFIAGYNYNEYIGIEGRFTQSYWERDYADTTSWSIFLKPQYRFWETDPNNDDYDNGYLTVYGLLGFGNTNVEGTDGDHEETSAWPEAIGQDILDETGFKWGIGISYTLVDIDNGVRKNTWSFFIDYTRDMSDESIHSRLYKYGNTGQDSKYYDELSVDSLTVGVMYTF